MSEHCLFCGGLVEEGECGVCGTLRMVTSEKHIHAPCPRCQDIRLGNVAAGPAAVQACTGCHGLFVPATEWDALIDYTNERKDEDIEPLLQLGDPYRSSQVPTSKVDLSKSIACIVCGGEMERFEFAGLSRIMVDVCPQHGIWLDAGELRAVVERVRQTVTVSKRVEIEPRRGFEAVMSGIIKILTRNPNDW